MIVAFIMPQDRKTVKDDHPLRLLPRLVSWFVAMSELLSEPRPKQRLPYSSFSQPRASQYASGSKLPR